MNDATAASLVAALRAIATEAQKPETARFFYDGLGKTQVLGVPIGKIFPIAKTHQTLALKEIEALLEDPHYEVRMAAVAVMDFQARQKQPVNRLADLYALYIGRHDRLDNWDFVDRAAPHVIGQYLADKDRSVLDELAASPDPWRRRTAIVATWWFIRRGETDDLFRIARALAGDPHAMIRKGLGSWLRAAGGVDPGRLVAFLEAERESLSAETIRMASADLPEPTRMRLRKGRPKHPHADA